MTKKLIVFALLAFPLLMSAQRSRMLSGRTSTGGSYSQGGSFAPGRIAGINPAYNPRYASNFYTSGFNALDLRNNNFFYGPRNGTILGRGFNSGGFDSGAQPNLQTFVPDPAQPVPGVYIPTYMRQDDSPSLGDIAKSLKSERKPAVLVWSNWDPVSAPPKRN